MDEILKTSYLTISSYWKRMKKGGQKDARLRQDCILSVDGGDLIFVEVHDEVILGLAERYRNACVVYDQEKIIWPLRGGLSITSRSFALRRDAGFCKAAVGPKPHKSMS